MDKRDIEALLNEYRGALFEFKVALEYSIISNQAEQFLSSLDRTTINRLEQYEKELYNRDKAKHKLIDLFAKDSAKKLYHYLGKGDEIRLISRDLNDLFAEGDFLVVQNKKSHFISLKLCKLNSFVNTKSGGIKSFFLKYFSSFSHIDEVQTEVNETLSKSFYRMMCRLFESEGLDYNGDIKLWPLSDRPGKLNEAHRNIIKEHYQTMNKVFYDQIVDLFSRDQSLFRESLYPLLGIGNIDVIQLSLFYTRNHIAKIVLEDRSLLTQEIAHLCISPFNPKLASFTLELKRLKLQIRVKPMNSFLQEALKIN